MDPVDALVAAVREEIDDLGLNTSPVDVRVCEILERILTRMNHLLGDTGHTRKNGTDRSYEQRLKDSGHLG